MISRHVGMLYKKFSARNLHNWLLQSHKVGPYPLKVVFLSCIAYLKSSIKFTLLQIAKEKLSFERPNSCEQH